MIDPRLDPDSPVVGVGEELVNWLAGSSVTGVGPSLPAGRADASALSAFADANPLRSLALAHSARLAERMANQLHAIHAASGGCDGQLFGVVRSDDIEAELASSSS